MKNTVILWFAAIGGFMLAASRHKIADVVPAVEPVVNALDDLEYNVLKISNMKSVNRTMLQNPNVRGMLGVIRYGEGTYDADGYKRLFGGRLFSSYADHPRIVVTKIVGGKPLKSSAAGAYQFLASTWDETAKALGLSDFTPANQDYAALARMAARGALDDVLKGNFTVAVRKLAKEWASLPFSPYGQPVIDLSKARDIFAANGGVSSDTTFV